MKITQNSASLIQQTEVEGDLILAIPNHLPEPTIEVDLQQLKDRPDVGVCRVMVENEDGLQARFWVSLRLNAQGRAILQVTARANQRGDDGIITGRDSSKEVTASWRL